MSAGDADAFVHRHTGPSAAELGQMLSALGLSSLDELTHQAVPASVRSERECVLPEALDEPQALAALRRIAAENRPMHNMIGLGYHDTVQPAVIRRNMLESPGWYTAYTPYQAEISQGRLEMLLNFQHLIADLTALPIANASLLDEATAAAEAMTLCHRVSRRMERGRFLVAADCLPQTLDVLSTRAEPLGIRLQVVAAEQMPDAARELKPFGALLQYPGADGGIGDMPRVAAELRRQQCLVVAACDLLALAVLRPPGEWGADIAVGSAQRFGVPPGCGGPHAGYMAVAERYRRSLPGRIIGVAKDGRGRQALRMALQTREQHIRREKATSNICTAQALPANLAAAWAIWHGPEGIGRIARRIHRTAAELYRQMGQMGLRLRHDRFFDTLVCTLPAAARRDAALRAAAQAGINLRPVGRDALALSVNECTGPAHIQSLLQALAGAAGVAVPPHEDGEAAAAERLPPDLVRNTEFLTHRVFNSYHSETEMMRYLRRLEGRDLSLDRAMIGLGSCTMKLNAAAEMEPISWPEFALMHPYAPEADRRGFGRIVAELETFICGLTGFAAVSMQPNSGAQGEFAGLLCIRRYFADRGEAQRDVCLVPRSAHGTNPASAVMAGMRVVVVDCDREGNISLDDLKRKLAQHAERLAALMVTYPSTHGVFEEHIRQVCELVHGGGGQVYLDGANFNAMMGLARPAELGADVCHLNLHKTFCIPHGGGGPGVGPIGVAAHLSPWLPGHLLPAGALWNELQPGEVQHAGEGAVAAAPWGSAGILPISWAFIRMMGAQGLRRAAQIAILNANYLAQRLQGHYPVLYKGKSGWVAHECVLDLRPLRASCGVTEEDVAKRLMDYGFHAPTMSFPVAGTLMVEPTESESGREIDRFCRAMIGIRREAEQIERGEVRLDDSALRRAPHTAGDLAEESWHRPYSRRQAAFPLGEEQAADKYWPAVGRIDNVAGDRNLVCTCPSPAEYA